MPRSIREPLVLHPLAIINACAASGARSHLLEPPCLHHHAAADRLSSSNMQCLVLDSSLALLTLLDCYVDVNVSAREVQALSTTLNDINDRDMLNRSVHSSFSSARPYRQLWIVSQHRRAMERTSSSTERRAMDRPTSSTAQGAAQCQPNRGRCPHRPLCESRTR